MVSIYKNRKILLRKNITIFVSNNSDNAIVGELLIPISV